MHRPTCWAGKPSDSSGANWDPDLYANTTRRCKYGGELLRTITVGIIPTAVQLTTPSPPPPPLPHWQISAVVTVREDSELCQARDSSGQGGVWAQEGLSR